LRLNRYISVCGIASRRKGEVIIRDGRITVNGVVITDPACNVDPEKDSVSLDATPVIFTPKRRYYVLNKPAGVIVSRGDTHGRSTVFDLLGDDTKGVFPVGRLDADTTGILLLTDDGDLAYRLTHPSYGVEKIYRAEVTGMVTKKDIHTLGEGILLDDGPSAPAYMTLQDSSSEGSLVEIVMHEGRKRQVRRMLREIGHPVRVLERVSFCGITAGNLPLGAYRPLTGDEIAHLKNTSNEKQGNEYHEKP